MRCVAKLACTRNFYGAYCHTMTLKGAALLALIGTTLATILAVWRFVMNLINHLNGVVAPVVVLSSLIEAFAWISVAVFFFYFHRTQSRS